MKMDGLLGPEKAYARLQELQSRIDSFSAKTVAPSNSLSSSPSGTDFQKTLTGVLPADPSEFNVAATSAQFGSMAEAAAEKYGLDPKVFKALVSTESSWNPNATSKVGAVGLCQLMPSTAAALGVTNPTDPAQSLDGGAKYLKQMLDQFGGDYSKALAAYNAGPGAVQRAHGVPNYHETVSYVKKILGKAGVVS